MATIKRSVSAKIGGDGKSEIMLRFSVRRGVQSRIKTGLYVRPEKFKDGRFIYPRINQTEAAELRSVESALIDLEQFLFSLCDSAPSGRLTSEYIAKQVERRMHPELCTEDDCGPQSGFFDWFSEYMQKHEMSDARKRHYRVLMRALRRFEAYQSTLIGDTYRINPHTFNADNLALFGDFLRKEPELCRLYPEIYQAIDYTGTERPCRALPKGENTITDTYRRLRAFFNWCNEQGYTDNRPFEHFKIKAAVYGSPLYISLDELRQIADADLSSRPALSVQRDIFVFQCLTGPRVSDLYRLKRSNIEHGVLSYIPGKTKGDRLDVVRVPLPPRALALLDRYKCVCEDNIFPFISQQKYNDAIKDIFKLCDITRQVTTLNTLTGKEEQRPINEIASSHMARRTFVGGLFKKVKDPNLIGALSGHKEGSKAFARYRDIDDDIRRDVMGNLDI